MKIKPIPIHPSFWTSVEVRDVCFGAKLLFLALESIEDEEDESFTTDPRQLAMWFPQFRANDIPKFLKQLHGVGLIRIHERGDVATLAQTFWSPEEKYGGWCPEKGWVAPSRGA